MFRIPSRRRQDSGRRAARLCVLQECRVDAVHHLDVLVPVGANIHLPVGELARMIEVQRTYEAGQGFLEREDERIRKTIQAIQAR